MGVSGGKIVQTQRDFHFLPRQPAVYAVQPLLEFTLLIPPHRLLPMGEDDEIAHALQKEIRHGKRTKIARVNEPFGFHHIRLVGMVRYMDDAVA